MTTEDITTCRLCGTTGQGETFCDGCGALLPAASPAAALSAAALSAAESSAAESSAAAPREPPADVHGRARQLIVPVADPSAPAQARQITPVLPGVPEPAVPAVRGPDMGDAATGPPCPWCGTPNPIDRHFCRRCAMLLTLRPEPAHLPWWRRILQWCRSGWRHRELPYAGQRPRLGHGSGRLGRWLVIGLVVGLVAFAADTWAGAAVTNVKDHFAHRYQVFPTTVRASRSDPRHPVRNLHDGFNNTWWGTGVTGDGAGVHVDATFDQPINLLDIMITPGAGVEPDAFTGQSRPQSIKVTLLSANGSTTNTTITLADSPGPETFAIQDSGVVRVRLTLESAYLAQSTSRTEVAIAELELFASSGGG